MNLLAQLSSFAQGASNAAAGNVSAPVDGISWLLRKAGLPIPAEPVGGSDWMARQGLTAQPRNRLAGLLGETAGMVGPAAVQAAAPRIAGGLLAIDDHAMNMARSNINSYMDKTGLRSNMILSNEDGLPTKYFHGTSQEFDKFSKAKGGSVWGDEASKGAHFFTADPYEADHFAKVAASKLGGTPKKIEANIDFKNPKIIDPDELSKITKEWLDTLPQKKKEFQLMTKEYESPDGGISRPLEYAILKAKKEGRDGVVVKLDDGTNWAVSFSNDAIKRLP